VSRVSAAHIGGKWATAVRDGNGRLKVIFWQLENGAPKRIGDSGGNGPEIIDVECQGLSFDEIGFGGADAEWRVVTAVRAKGSKLRLLTWAWKPATGKVTLADDSGDQPEQISLLRLIPLGNTRYVTAVRDNATATDTQPGHLTLITWTSRRGGIRMDYKLPFDADPGWQLWNGNWDDPSPVTPTILFLPRARPTPSTSATRTGRRGGTSARRGPAACSSSGTI
jgi:hypothetical protein